MDVAGTVEKLRLCDPVELVTLIRDGNIVALDRMTRCYGARLLATGRKYCRDEEEAKDAVQDALLSAGEHLNQFRGEGSPEGWLLRMVVNACRGMQRGRKNDPTLHRDVEDIELKRADPSPEDEATRGQVAAALGKVLLEIKPNDRLILLLSEAEGWRAPEIAEQMDLTPNAVRSRLKRMRAKLRPRIEHLREQLEG